MQAGLTALILAVQQQAKCGFWALSYQGTAEVSKAEEGGLVFCEVRVMPL